MRFARITLLSVWPVTHSFICLTIFVNLHKTWFEFRAIRGQAKVVHNNFLASKSNVAEQQIVKRNTNNAATYYQVLTMCKLKMQLLLRSYVVRSSSKVS